MKIIEVPTLGESDTEALRVVKNVVQAFGKLDIAQVEFACNRVREEFLAKWKAETGETVEGSDIKRLSAIEEAEPKFELWKPTSVTIAMLDQRFRSINNSTAPQMTATNPLNKQSVIYTLMRWVTRHGNEFYTVDSATQGTMSTLTDSTIHELLHTCGDLPPKHDGVVRQTWIGVKAIKPMLDKV